MTLNFQKKPRKDATAKDDRHIRFLPHCLALLWRCLLCPHKELQFGSLQKDEQLKKSCKIVGENDYIAEQASDLTQMLPCVCQDAYKNSRAPHCSSNQVDSNWNEYNLSK